MNYIHATESTVIEYPYSIQQLKRDNPNTSFPTVISDEELSSWNVYPVVTEQQAPNYIEHSENAEQLQPKKIGNSWVVQWKITIASDEEKAHRTAVKAQELRTIRNEQLKNSDHTQLADFTGSEGNKADWRIYRQALRDMPKMPGFPWQLSKTDSPLEIMKRLGV